MSKSEEDNMINGYEQVNNDTITNLKRAPKLNQELEDIIATQNNPEARKLILLHPIYVAGEDRYGNKIVVILSYRIPEDTNINGVFHFFCSTIRNIVCCFMKC